MVRAYSLPAWHSAAPSRSNLSSGTPRRYTSLVVCAPRAHTHISLLARGSLVLRIRVFSAPEACLPSRLGMAIRMRQ